MAKPGALEDFRAGDHKRRDVTLADAIDKYADDSAKAIGRTKSQVLKRIKNFDIAGKPCADINIADIVAFAQEKLKSGVTPQTVSNYVSHISADFTVAGPAWKYPLNEKAMREAPLLSRCTASWLSRSSRPESKKK